MVRWPNPISFSSLEGVVLNTHQVLLGNLCRAEIEDEMEGFQVSTYANHAREKVQMLCSKEVSKMKCQKHEGDKLAHCLWC